MHHVTCLFVHIACGCELTQRQLRNRGHGLQLLEQSAWRSKLIGLVSSAGMAFAPHPEVSAATGLWLFCTPALQGPDWACVASPLCVAGLLLCVSGVPIQERQARQRWGADPDYQAWRRRAWLLFPLGPRWCAIVDA